MSRRAEVVWALILAACLPACSSRVQPSGETRADDATEGGDESSTTNGGSTSSTDGVDGETSEGDDPPDPTFVPEYDIAVIEMCDPWAQDCPPGQKCVPYASAGGVWDANKCVDVLGDAGVGEPCEWGGIVEATDTCDADSMCWNVQDVDGVLVGICHAFCTGTADDPQCPPGSACQLSGEGVINVCIADCDPLVQDCAEGLGCYWGGSSFQCIFATQNLDEGEPCGFINDCRPGLFCAAADTLPACEGSACCAAFCDLGAPTCDLPGTTCVSFYEQGQWPPGEEHIGLCLEAPP